MTKALYRDPFPKADPKRLAKIAKEKPLAGLVHKGYRIGAENSKLSEPSSGISTWGCLGPVGRNGVRWVCTVDAKTAFVAKREAAVILECEPGQITIAKE